MTIVEQSKTGATDKEMTVAEPVTSPKPIWSRPTMTRLDIKRTMAYVGTSSDGSGGSSYYG